MLCKHFSLLKTYSQEIKSEKFEVNAMPTIIFINNKKIKHRIEGSNIEAIKNYLKNN